MNGFQELKERIMENQNLTELLTYDELQQNTVKRFNDMPGRLNEIDGVECNICKNKGYIEVWDGERIFTKQCKCSIERKSRKLLKESGLETAIIDKTFDNFKSESEWQETIKLSAETFVKDKSDKWFFIGGQSGAGKTHICTAICGEMLKQGKAIRYMLWVEDLRRLKSVVNDSVSYDKLFYNFADAEVLYIDDLFKSKEVTQSDIQRTYEIIDYRYRNELKTIISSEKLINDIFNIDTAIGGRIYERSKNYLLQLNKDDKKNVRLKL